MPETKASFQLVPQDAKIPTMYLESIASVFDPFGLFVECRRMSSNVVECRRMSSNVVECRRMSSNVGAFRDLSPGRWCHSSYFGTLGVHTYKKIHPDSDLFDLGNKPDIFTWVRSGLIWKFCSDPMQDVI
jgi:hypothetical protein